MKPITNPVIEQMRALVAQADAGVPFGDVTICWVGGVMSTIDNPFALMGLLHHCAYRVSRNVSEKAGRIAVPN